MVPSCPPLSYEELQQINIWAHYPGRNWLNGPTKLAPYNQANSWTLCHVIAAITKHLVKVVGMYDYVTNHISTVYTKLKIMAQYLSQRLVLKFSANSLGPSANRATENCYMEKWWWQAGAILANAAILGGTICLAVTLESLFWRKKNTQTHETFPIDTFGDSMTPHLIMEIKSFDCLGEVHIISRDPGWKRLTQALHIWLSKKKL